jgi:hypothetical protein
MKKPAAGTNDGNWGTPAVEKKEQKEWKPEPVKVMVRRLRRNLRNYYLSRNRLRLIW